MSRSFTFFILLFSCNTSDIDRTFFNVHAINYSDALKEGFQRVPVDVELIEKEANGITIGLHYTDDRKTLLAKSWRFYKRTEKSFIDSVVNNSNMYYLIPSCEVDSERRDFCLIDKRNRLFIGRIFQQEKGENYSEIVYYFPE